MPRPITERMAEARDKMIERRVPRVFYLNTADFDEFAATKPPTVEALFALPLGHKPSPMTCLGFDGIAVRHTEASKPDKNGHIRSILFSRAGTSVCVPRQ